MFRILVLFTVAILLCVQAQASIKGGVDYRIPIDYSKFSEAELESKADKYYSLALTSKVMNEDMTSALNLYGILTNISPENTTYILRLGKLYDILGKNRYAKGNYYRAKSIAPKTPEPYFYLGDYFYSREEFKKALRFYLQAVDNGYGSHYETLYNIGDIYQKLGDTKNSILYFEKAANIESGIDLDLKMQQIRNSDITNKEYYRR